MEPASPHTLLFTDHEAIQDISRQMTRTKVQLDRSVLNLRSWARDLGRRLADSRVSLSGNDDLRTLGETVGGLAHNLNNSLAAILAYAEMMLRETQQTETSRRRVTVMRDVALEASLTVRRLQEFVSRQPQVAFGPVGLPAVIAEALEMTAPRWRDEAQRRGVVISVVQDLEALPPVEANAFELRDALLRLILNAVAAMPQGGTLTIRAISEESGWVVVEVRDTGVGMPEEVRRRVAERARDLRPGPDSRHGLAHVSDIMERHGGSLSIESEPGKGTTVRMRLHASRFQIIPPSEGMVERVLAPEHSARVLLVDDDPRLVAVLSDMLRTEGHEVTTATNGDEALALFSADAHDVVITDLGMPRMNGWEVAERIKARSPATAVFLLTGWGEGVSAHDSSQYVDRVIAKPVSAESLLEQLAELKRSGASSA
ncbi:MAG TPA: response regulator [Methylomirabilota bacterium]|jgi:signal transduction histidine kinase/ActR/RegA family two-component response regulator|nr:response regulator [Methylomirabilota bacterium]